MLNDLTVLIVTWKSDGVIENLLKKIPDLNSVIIENSNNAKFKKNIEQKFKKTKCILTGDNRGFGSALNLGFKKIKSKYYLILNPDIEIKKSTIKKLYNYLKKYEDISVIAPSTVNDKGNLYVRHGNFKFINPIKHKDKNLISVGYVSGHAFLIKKEILSKIGYFDENIFLNFEEWDLFFRVVNTGGKICVIKNIFAKHHEGKSCMESPLEADIALKWHYGWSYYYFYKKNYNVCFSLFFSGKFLFINIFKLLYFFFSNQKYKFNLINSTIKGNVASILGKKSFYRP